MILTAKSSNTDKLTFNDLGKAILGVAPDALHRELALDAGDVAYLRDTSGVLFSAQKGDIRRYVNAGLLDINHTEAVANNGTVVFAHNFYAIPNVVVLDSTGKALILGTDYEVTHNAALTQTTVKNISGGALNLIINIG